MSSHKIAVLNQKGGVGKTTTAINLSAGLAMSSKNVLLIDLDPQANTTSGLGFSKEESLSSVDTIFNSALLSEAIKETATPHLYVLPATPALTSAEVTLVNLPQREHQLALMLEMTDYDYVIIDCPPSVGLLTINALTCADFVLIPVQAEYYALEGLGQLLHVVQQIHETVNPSLELLGVLLTMYDKRTVLSGQVQNELKKHFDTKLLSTVIPRNVRLAEAPSYGQTIFEYDKWSKGARAYKQLAKEIEKRVAG
jgi:chromosome partitioning protein